MASRDLIDLVVLGAIWGASFLFMRVAAPQFGPVPLIAARVGIGAVFLLAVLARRGGLGGLAANAAPLTVLGAVNSAIPFTLFAYAVLSVTAGFAAMLNSTAPLFGALVAFVWLHETPARTRLIGLAIGFTGVLILVWDRLSFSSDGGLLAVLAGLSAAVLYGIAANYTKRRLTGVDPMVIATGSLLAATAFLLVPAALYWPASAPTAIGWISTILLGVICTGVAYVLYFRLLARVGPSRTLSVTYLIPVFGLLWGYMLLDEAITAQMATACAVILAGVALATGALGR
jgi:drug/metabolite transporter (DMT)-like permease